MVPGYELALAAALGPRLTAGVVQDMAAGERLLDEAGQNGASVLIERAGASAEASDGMAPGIAEPLLGRVHADGAVAGLAARLLRDVWVVESIDLLPGDFAGVAVTRAGRLFDSSSGELSQAPTGGAERLLEELGRRDELVAASERAAAAEIDARTRLEQAATTVVEADSRRESAEAPYVERSAAPRRPPSSPTAPSG